MKKNILAKLSPFHFLMLLIAGIINAIGVTLFIAPVQLYDSGISGTSILLSQLTPDYLSLSFFLILLPLMMPGVVSGYLLAFIISLDDFIITNFVKGAGMETLPTAIYGSVKQGIKPNIMAISTLMLGVSILFVTLSYLINRKGQKSL